MLETWHNIKQTASWDIASPFPATRYWLRRCKPRSVGPGNSSGNRRPTALAATAAAGQILHTASSKAAIIANRWHELCLTISYDCLLPAGSGTNISSNRNAYF